MIQFYFYSTYPAAHVNVKQLFSQTFTKYLHMYKMRERCIESQIITSELPSHIDINGTSLSEAIYSVEDRDCRILAINAFVKYPIDKFVNPEFWDEDGAEWDYTFNGLDAVDLYFAHRMEWFVLSMPVTDSYACDMLTIVNRSNSTKTLDIPNFYGDNEAAIIQVIDQIEQYTKTPLDALVENVFAGHECRMTDEFIVRYEALPGFAQKSINDLFRVVRDRGMLFPVIKANKLHIKYCEGDELDGLYELRDQSGIRVYFRVDDAIIYLGNISTKAESEGVEQTADMRRAQLYICQLKELINK